MPFEPASQGWITQERSTPGHIGDPRQATAAKGETLFRVVLPGRRHLSRAGDPLGRPFPGWVKCTYSGTDDANARAAALAPNLGDLRLDAAGDDAQLHGPPGAFAAGDRDRAASSASATTTMQVSRRDSESPSPSGGVLTGLAADRISPRWLYPAVLLCWSLVGFCDRLGHHLS